ncbi:MAG: tetratricopeptide repeat protein [Spirochaetes bacterium]|nr:tetratricopeptide repeat protein [Spirochaetota bacterium]
MTLSENQRTSQRAQKKINSLILREMQIGMDELIELRQNPSLLVDTGYEYIEMGEYEKALRLFSIGAMLDSSDPDILNGLGIALCELGKFKKSRQVLERSIRFNPDDAVTLANLAGVCWEMGDPEQAIYYYSKSLEVTRDIEEIHFNLINLYIETGALFMAYISCLDFVERFPEDGEAKELMEEIILNLAISMY